MKSIKHVQNHRFDREDKLFFDANVWLAVEGPQDNPNDPIVRDYSKALHAIKSADAAIFIDCVVLSEFINRYSRRLFHIARESDRSVTDYKIYRDSPNFESGAREIAKAGRRLLQHAKAVETGFESCNRLAVLAAFENERADFNDGMIAELCRLRGFRLVTNDGDFRNVDLDILTANKGMVP